MSTLRLYSQKQIAEALGVSRQAVGKRAAKGLSRKGEAQWTVSRREKARGFVAIYYTYAELPADVRKAIDRAEKTAKPAIWRRKIEAEHAKTTVDAAIKLVSNMESELKQLKAALKRCLESCK